MKQHRYIFINKIVVITCACAVVRACMVARAAALFSFATFELFVGCRGHGKIWGIAVQQMACIIIARSNWLFCQSIPIFDFCFAFSTVFSLVIVLV